MPAVPVAAAAVLAGARRGWPPLRTATVLGLVAYLALLGGLVFFPLPLGSAACSRPLDLQLVPFETIDRAIAGGAASHVGRIGLGNIAAFVPLGLLVPLLVPWRNPIMTGLVASAVASAGVELGQLAVSMAIGCGYRTTDIDDVILNALGGLVGALGAGLVLLLLGREAFARPTT